MKIKVLYSIRTADELLHFKRHGNDTTIHPFFFSLDFSDQMTVREMQEHVAAFAELSLEGGDK